MNKKQILEEVENQIKEESDKKQEEITKQVEKNELYQKAKSDLEEKRSKIDADLNILKGVGDITIKKLAHFGINNIWDLSMASAPMVWTAIGDSNKSLEWCVNLVIAANTYLTEQGGLDEPLVKSKKLLESEYMLKRFSTGDKALDQDFFFGGIESKAITEFFGKYQTGKTQISYCTTVVAAANDRRVLFIDTENTYSPTRINEIAIAKGFDAEKVQDNIVVHRARSASKLQRFIREELSKTIENEKIQLVVVDSIIALHRAEFVGRAFLASRQQSLSEIMQTLLKAAEYHDIAVIITNQVLDSPDPYKPGSFATGGNIIAHSSTHRIYLKSDSTKEITIKGKKTKINTSRILMLDSPRYPRIEKIISLRPNGVKMEDPSNMDDE